MGTNNDRFGRGLASRLALWALAALTCGAAAAQPAADFYRGKTIDFVVGYPPGAGYDLYARTLAQFMGKFIPGDPKIVVKNMPGASSLNGLEYLITQAPKDGTAIGIFNPTLVNLSMLEPNRVKVDFSKLTLIGNMSSDTKTCFALSSSKIKSVNDLKGRKSFVIGGTSQGSGFVYGAILRAVFGDSVKIVLGYPSNSNVWLAMERGEVDGNCTGWGVIPAMRPEWIRDRKVNVLVQFADPPDPRVPPSPTIYDQEMPDNLKTAIRFLTIVDSIPRPVIAPPGLAKERTAMLRKAFFATLRDPAFLAYAKKAGLVIDPMQPEVLAQKIAQIRSTSASAVELARKLSKH